MTESVIFVVLLTQWAAVVAFPVASSRNDFAFSRAVAPDFIRKALGAAGLLACGALFALPMESALAKDSPPPAAFFLPLSALAFSVMMTPGPANFLVSAVGANIGIRGTLPFVFGVCFALATQTFLVGFGLGPIFSEHPQLHAVMRGASFAFICWLAWQIAISKIAEARREKISPLSFRQGALFHWVNPKGWAATISATAAFIPAGAEDAHIKVALVAGILVFFAVLGQMMWAMFGVVIGKFLRKNPAWMRGFNIVMAIVLVATMLPILFMG